MKIRHPTHLSPFWLPSTCFFQTCKLFKGYFTQITTKTASLLWYLAMHVSMFWFYWPRVLWSQRECTAQNIENYIWKCSCSQWCNFHWGWNLNCPAVKIQMWEDKNVDMIIWVTFSYYHTLSVISFTSSSRQFIGSQATYNLPAG